MIIKDSTLLNIALFFSIIGTITLFLISLTIHIPEKDIGKIIKEDIDKDIIIKGRIIKIDEKESATILTLSTIEYIDVVFFDKINDIKVNDTIRVSGTVQFYNDDKELIGEKILD